MADAHIHLHPDEPLASQGGKGHNRWHPDIAPTVRVARGSTVEIETIDAMDRQIKPGMTGQELLSVEMGRVHPLTGPVYVEGAEPGDLLAVKVEAIQTASRGYTFIAPGFGFLREHFPEPHLVHWEMSGGFARSRDLPGVRIPGAPFMGVMGVAPSHELLADPSGSDPRNHLISRNNVLRERRFLGFEHRFQRRNGPSSAIARGT